LGAFGLDLCGIGGIVKARFSASSRIRAVSSGVRLSGSVSVMEPAYHIPLTDDELKALGELCAIQGQIEWLMANIVMHLLDVPLSTANTILGSTVARTNADVWIEIIRAKCTNDEVRSKAEALVKPLKQFSDDRNVVVHAIYGHAESESFWSLHSYGVRSSKPVVGVRRRNQTRFPNTKIKETRNAGAKASQALQELLAPLTQDSFAPPP
jgi:hypothetical protein